VIAYTVARRTRELGVRVDLGAGRVQALTTLLGNGLRVTTIGIAARMVVSLAAGRIFTPEFPGVENSLWMSAAVSVLLRRTCLQHARRRSIPPDGSAVRRTAEAAHSIR